MSGRSRSAVLGLVLILASGDCGAADTFLDRSKVQEAVPYGTSIEPPESAVGEERGRRDDPNRPHRTTPSDHGPPSTAAAGRRPGEAGE